MKNHDSTLALALDWGHLAGAHDAVRRRTFTQVRAECPHAGALVHEGFCSFLAALYCHYGCGAFTPAAVEYYAKKIEHIFAVEKDICVKISLKLWEDLIEDNLVLGALEAVPDLESAAAELRREIVIRVLVCDDGEQTDLGLGFWEHPEIDAVTACSHRLFASGDGIDAVLAKADENGSLESHLGREFLRIQQNPLLLLSHRLRCALAQSGHRRSGELPRGSGWSDTDLRAELTTQTLATVVALLWPFRESDEKNRIETPISCKKLSQKIKKNVKNAAHLHGGILRLHHAGSELLGEEKNLESILMAAEKMRLVYRLQTEKEKTYGLSRWGLKLLKPFCSHFENAYFSNT